MAAVGLDLAQCGVGGAGPTGNRRTRFERQLFGQRDQRMGRAFHVFRVRAMGCPAVNVRHLVFADLGPPGAALIADVAAGVVMDHHPLPDPRNVPINPRPDRYDDPAGLVSGDYGSAVAHRLVRFALGQFAKRPVVARCAVGVQITAAKTRCLDLDDHFARPWRRIVELHDLDPLVSGKCHTPHIALPLH